MALLRLSDAELHFGTQVLLGKLNLTISKGERLGLLGRNGVGKTTLFKVLTGEQRLDDGERWIDPGVKLSRLEQELPLEGQTSVFDWVAGGLADVGELLIKYRALLSSSDDNALEELSSVQLALEANDGWSSQNQVETTLSQLGLDGDEYLADLSGGWRRRVALARALVSEPDLLLLDEPTNHLDLKAIKWLEDVLSDFKNTVIVVSHDRHFLNKVCTHIADIDFKKITVYTGNYDFWRKSAEIAQRLRADQKRKADEKAKELKTFIARFSANAAKAKQATSRQKQLEKLDLESLPVSTRKYPYINFELEKESGKDMLTVENISKTVNGLKVLDNLSFQINKNDKVMFIGDDLAKSTLFSILAGETEPDSGSINWGVTTKRSFFPNDNTEYFKDNSYTLVDWLRQYSENQDESFVRGFLGRMLFSGEEAQKKTSVLSGGEKVRCMLSKMMLSFSNVLIFDNPTDHLDLESITSLNDGLINFPGTVLFTSHDHEFIQTIANRVIELSTTGTLQQDKVTDYDSYVGLG